MQRITGTYVSNTTLGEVVRSFVPYSLPPQDPALESELWQHQLRAAGQALTRLSVVTGLVPSVDWLLYSTIRREALLTSQIEGTQATLTDLFDHEAGLVTDNADDVEEVTNYLQAFRLVRKNMRDEHGLPLSVRLLCDAHRLLLSGTRGASKQPGEIRRSQNWIGGSRPGNAAFVPPPPEHLAVLLADLEQFIHAEQHGLPPLVRIALLHAQFETIHPFLDGNGRLGRLLITALFEHWGLLSEPLLYLSGYLKRHQGEYYRLLSAVRTQGDWEAWVGFFLDAVTGAATEAEGSIIALATLVTSDRRRLLVEPMAGSVAYRLFEMLPTTPRFTIESIRQKLATSFPTANAAVKLLVALGIVEERSGQRKNRVFSYQRYIDILSQ